MFEIHQYLLPCAFIVLFSLSFLAIFYRLFTRLTSGRFEINVDISDKNFFITGATSGLGLETCRQLAKHNAGQVFMLCRNIEYAHKLAQLITEETGNSKVKAYECNLCSLKSVRRCAQQILRSNVVIDVLINNAGIGGDGPATKQKTEDGLNIMMQSNHFGHFLLTNLLLDRLKSNQSGARIINVTSMLHGRAGDFDVNDLNYENQSKKDKLLRLYSWSKLANVLFTRELAKRLQGSGVTANSLHPGTIVTDIGKARPKYSADAAIKGILSNAEEGVQTHLYLSISPELRHVSGHYFADCRPGGPVLNALDDMLASQLWDRSVFFTRS